jgi:transposase InsO family protein
MVKRCGPPSQGWLIFLRNHAPTIAAMDLFVVPTIGFDLLYVLVIVRLARRDLVWINVTPNPTAEWIARQITEAFPWSEAPRYLIRDRDRVYGAAATQRMRAMGIRDKPIAPGSPWQNGFVERLIGSTSRVCRPYHCPGRGTLAPDPAGLRALLQRCENTSIVGQRFARLASGSANRTHHVTSTPRRPPSPLRPNLSFRYTHRIRSSNVRVGSEADLTRPTEFDRLVPFADMASWRATGPIRAFSYES